MHTKDPVPAEPRLRGIVAPGRMANVQRGSSFRILHGDCSMRRLLSLPVLAIATWASCLALLGLLGIMLAARAWHPHFLPVTCLLAMAIVAGLALIVGALWRIIRGPRRREALSWLLLGSAPLWFLGGSALYGLAIGSGRKIPINLAVKLMAPLGESVMDLEARFRYPQRTVGEKVVMISTAMPVEEARAQVAAMDRHVCALERGWVVRPQVPSTGFAGRCWASSAMPFSACVWGAGRARRPQMPRASAPPIATRSRTACS